MIELMEHQLDAIDNLGNGKILYGEVGIGKSATVLGYYMKKERPRDIYVITTAKKRDSRDWEIEAGRFGLFADRDKTSAGTVTVDSWNKLWEYRDVVDAFFIFDEQRVVGHGVWVKNFIRIARRNTWVLLTATPGDTWIDYAPVFVANGFYKSLTAFSQEHVIYEPFVPYPKIKGYRNERKLELLRNEILVEMPYLREDKQRVNFLPVAYDIGLIKQIQRDRWHLLEDRPIKDAADMWRLMRRIINSDPSRIEMVRFLLKAHPRMIIFYNFNYELDILRGLGEEITVAEYNGHKHEEIPQTDKWVYLVQYLSGAEGWNCVVTDAMILYSLSYSYRNFVQARGRIDRLTSPFSALFYYIFVSSGIVDRAIKQSLDNKKSFNEKSWIQKEFKM